MPVITATATGTVASSKAPTAPTITPVFLGGSAPRPSPPTSSSAVPASWSAWAFPAPSYLSRVNRRDGRVVCCLVLTPVRGAATPWSPNCRHRAAPAHPTPQVDATMPTTTESRQSPEGDHSDRGNTPRPRRRVARASGPAPPRHRAASPRHR